MHLLIVQSAGQCSYYVQMSRLIAGGWDWDSSSLLQGTMSSFLLLFSWYDDGFLFYFILFFIFSIFFIWLTTLNLYKMNGWKNWNTLFRSIILYCSKPYFDLVPFTPPFRCRVSLWLVASLLITNSVGVQLLTVCYSWHIDVYACISLIYLPVRSV